MISPVTVVTLPGTGLPSTAAPTVVADHGLSGFLAELTLGIPTAFRSHLRLQDPARGTFLGRHFFVGGAERHGQSNHSYKCKHAFQSIGHSFLLSL